MTYIFSVAYPAGTKFDMDYYLAKHMSLVLKLWAPHGLKAWKVAQYSNAEAKYAVQAWLEWESKEHADKATTSADAATIFGDVPNFSDKSPDILSGELVGSASA
ncbi:hypothetical protein F4802DRAFT_549503 [Xylaria palmicola]|nr:hypothetical protein F4802DRAFT_549503 [Xylaria palmicola]